MGVLKCVVFFVVVAWALQFADAQGSGLSGLINISGTVFCTANGTITVNATAATPPFPNAMVEVVCDGNVISSTITNGSGMFNISLNPVRFPLPNLLSPNCNMRVATPLSNCNRTLPSTGFLQAPLQLVGTVVRGLLNVVNLVPGTFQVIRTN